jgi:hypothetical protein
MKPVIAFCLTCKGRAAHLEKTLAKNLADNADYQNLVFVVLDYHGPDPALLNIANTHQEEINRGRLTFYTKSGDGPFHMTHAKNMAHRLGMLQGADILVNLDADNFTGAGFAEYVAEHFSTKSNIFLGPGNIKGQGKRFRGCSGRIACSVQQFLKVGGYDERFETWSPDDMDFNIRLQRSGYDVVEIDRRFLQAIPHTDGLRFREYPHANDPTLDPYDLVHKLFSASTVVNYGRIGMGRVARNFGAEAIDVMPLPTRIFGIGLHKTATTSLHSALGILGFDSAHWKSGDWARDIWNEMNALGKSKTLERSYALSDLPICLLYEKLDVAYPGSKFILTVRDESKWIESVRAHWSYDRNPHRWEWDAYPISNRLHQALYGQKSFDASAFLARYRRHNEGVREYFKNRSADLLVMNVDAGDGWKELCDFLGKPMPTCNYPREYRTV